MNTMIDIERIKQQIPIADLIAQSGLTVTGKGHTLTTVEHDSLKIFTNNNSWTWYSQVGRHGKALGGSVIDWYMHTNQCDRREAIRALAAMINDGLLPSTHVRLGERAKVKEPEGWTSPKWQIERRHELEKVQDTLLNLAEGEPGRIELTKRGIKREMWQLWGLGYGLAWNNRARRMLPAIWIPYMNQRITAIQYRFIGIKKDDPNADRFGQLTGSKRYLCGLHLCYDPTQLSNSAASPSPFPPPHQPSSSVEPGLLNTLFLVEGEWNAVSVSQETYGQSAADAISFGSQNNISNPEVARMAAAVAKRYKHLVIWADEPEVALAAMSKMPASLKILPVRSPVDDKGAKLDANELLQRGELANVVFGLMRKLSEP